MSEVNELDEGMIQIYTGEGKGKTTASFGLAMRAKGHGLDVRIIQFIKHLHTSEMVSAENLGIPVYHAPSTDASVGCRELYDLVHGWLKEGDVDVVILDETGEAMRRGHITREDIEELIKLKPEKTELVFTGRGLDERIGDLADLVTEMKPVKHYFDAGWIARKGIEY